MDCLVDVTYISGVQHVHRGYLRAKSFAQREKPHSSLSAMFWPIVHSTCLLANRSQIKCTQVTSIFWEWFMLLCTHCIELCQKFTLKYWSSFSETENLKPESLNSLSPVQGIYFKRNVQIYHQFHPGFLHWALRLFIWFFCHLMTLSKFVYDCMNSVFYLEW